MNANKRVWVAAYLRNEEGEILVRKRGAHCAVDPGMYGPPGGKVEPGEYLKDALFRELLEETGLTGHNALLLQVYDTPRGVCFFYRIHEWSGQLRREYDHGPWYWLYPDQLDGEKVQGALARWLGWDAPHCREVLP